MMKLTIFSVFLLILSLLLSACNFGTAEETPTPLPSNDPPPFTIVTQEPEVLVNDNVSVTGRDEAVSNTDSSAPAGNNGVSSANPNNVDTMSTNYQVPVNLPPCVSRSDWPYVYTVVAGDTLSQIARRTQSTVDTLVNGNCLSNANILSVGQTLYVPNAVIYQPQISVSAISPTISRSHLQSDNPLFNLSWSVTDRPPNSNLRFEQWMPNGVLRNIELPRNQPYIASSGDGTVRLHDPGNVSQVLIRVSLFNMTTTAVITSQDLVINILTAPPSNQPYACYGFEANTTQVYAGFQGTSIPVVGTIPANTIIEIVTREFNGYYGVRYAGQYDIAWTDAIVARGDCSNLPSYGEFTGHGSGLDMDNGRTCVFVGDTTVPIYASPQIGADILHTLQDGERYLFNAYGDSWQSGDVSGYWIEIYYDVDSNTSGYVQNTGGHLEGSLCLER